MQLNTTQLNWCRTIFIICIYAAVFSAPCPTPRRTQRCFSFAIYWQRSWKEFWLLHLILSSFERNLLLHWPEKESDARSTVNLCTADHLWHGIQFRLSSNVQIWKRALTLTFLLLNYNVIFTKAKIRMWSWLLTFRWVWDAKSTGHAREDRSCTLDGIEVKKSKLRLCLPTTGGQCACVSYRLELEGCRRPHPK